MKFLYPLHLDPEDDPNDGFVAQFRDVPEAIAGGRDRTEILRIASEVLAAALRLYAKRGAAIPEPSAARPGEVLVTIPAHDAYKIAIMHAFAASGMTLAAFGRSLGRDDMDVRRILDPSHPTKIATLEEVLAKLGRRAIIEFGDAI